MQGAADAYTAVLALPDAACADRLAAASNRAACSLAQRDYTKVIDDCNLAFGLLMRVNGLTALDVQDYLQSNKKGLPMVSDSLKLGESLQHVSQCVDWSYVSYLFQASSLNVLVLFKAPFVDVLVCQTHAAQLQHKSQIVRAADHVLAADMRQF